MKRFLSIILTLTVLVTPIISLNCSAMERSKVPNSRAQVVIGDESKFQSCNSKPKSKSFLGKAWGWTWKTVVSAVGFGVMMVVLDSYSPNCELEKNLGTKVGEFFRNLNQSSPSVFNFPGEAWSKISGSGTWETLKKSIEATINATKRHGGAFLSVFQAEFNNSTITA